MRIGMLVPSIYMSQKRFKDMIFAPRDLALALADDLVARGHKVFLFTTHDTKSRATIVGGEPQLAYEKLKQEKIKNAPEPKKTIATFYTTKREFERDLTLKAYHMAHKGKLDIIHSYHDDLAHYFDDLSPIPTIYTMHDPLPQKGSIEHWRLERFTHHNFISISSNQRQTSKLNWVATIHHGIETNNIPFQEKPKDYLAFIGRFVKAKGIESAVRVSKKTKHKLKVAGRSFNEKDSYYTKTLAPLFKHNSVKEMGMLNTKQKYTFLKNAKTMLFPIQWEEPFGLVMVEAMACGTPVVAYNHGSVPEVIEDGKTGFVVTNEKSMVKAVKKIYDMPRQEYLAMRHACRKHVERHFSVERMAQDHETLYHNLIKRNKK
jgi:glycosyltransferase involved in cell wall biosynthesis|tara:strand:+ start:6678 stop:7802 length:1125 start_codon:yes stop_codon:yes gene_type:complete